MKKLRKLLRAFKESYPGYGIVGITFYGDGSGLVRDGQDNILFMFDSISELKEKLV